MDGPECDVRLDDTGGRAIERQVNGRSIGRHQRRRVGIDAFDAGLEVLVGRAVLQARSHQRKCVGQWVLRGRRYAGETANFPACSAAGPQVSRRYTQAGQASVTTCPTAFLSTSSASGAVTVPLLFTSQVQSAH